MSFDQVLQIQVTESVYNFNLLNSCQNQNVSNELGQENQATQDQKSAQKHVCVNQQWCNSSG
jgi:hypothetical protein